VLYDTVEMSGEEQNLALRFRPDGIAESISAPPRVKLPPTDVFRIRRTTRVTDTESVHLGRTLEDTPFYSRSIIQCHLLGMRAAGIHESFDGGRLSSPIVKLMLPFRMPRRPIRG
jgi:carotenoid 1,2-hydratase